MNFFGHALLAQRHESTRGGQRLAFVLGAMLPDFASMLRLRPPNTSLEALQAGVAFHHLTDEAFHGSRSFMDLSQQAYRFLDSHGLSRGAARAVAHVGVELLLDGAFAREPKANDAYLGALECGLTEPALRHVHWQTTDGGLRFQQLCHNLVQRGPFPEHTPAELVAERLRRILDSRPRLAMDEAGQSVVREWVMTARPLIVSGAPSLLREVEQRLQSRTEA